MTKQDVINAVSHRVGIEREATRAVLEETINVVRESLCKGNSIYIRGLFTLAPKKRASKIAQNILKREAIILPAHFVPSAKFSKDIIDTMKKLPVKD